MAAYLRGSGSSEALENAGEYPEVQQKLFWNQGN